MTLLSRKELFKRAAGIIALAGASKIAQAFPVAEKPVAPPVAVVEPPKPAAASGASWWNYNENPSVPLRVMYCLGCGDEMPTGMSSSSPNYDMSGLWARLKIEGKSPYSRNDYCYKCNRRAYDSALDAAKRRLIRADDPNLYDGLKMQPKLVAKGINASVEASSYNSNCCLSWSNYDKRLTYNMAFDAGAITLTSRSWNSGYRKARTLNVAYFMKRHGITL